MPEETINDGVHLEEAMALGELYVSHGLLLR